MTPSYEALRELVERVERASEGSRELDARVWCAAFDKQYVEWSGLRLIYNEDCGGILLTNCDVQGWALPNYTSSLDAITALIGRVNPLMLHGAQLAYMHDGAHGGHCWLYGPSSPSASDIDFYGEGHAATLPLAMCSALLRAKLQEKEG